ncbi:dead-box atp-dependent rna helicase 40 [Hordeum vulgare]|nr:dead-box atp-dependent rna helicase 40 [Hordeum vulgare]
MAGGSSSKKTLSQGAWLGSEICEGRIEALRHRRMLPLASQVLVRIPGAETTPTPPFISDWLNFFGLQPHHLAPNTILQLSAFVILCEGFLGIEPRLDLWRSLFFFKQQSIALDKAELEKLAGPCQMTPCGVALVHHRSKSGFPQLPL